MEFSTTSLIIFAIFATLGLVVTIAVEIVEAVQPPGRGCEFTPGGNASKTRCVH